jgi:hypothetical protein
VTLPRAAWVIAGAAVPVHLALALATDLSPDEAYYLCAARAGRTVVDHPPLITWLLAVTDRWSAVPVELRVRIWAIALSFATSVALVRLAESRGAGRDGCVLAAWLGTWALLPMAGGFVTTPDTPSMLATTLALLALATPGVTSAAGAAGALLVGALAKVVALPLGTLLAVFSSRSIRERVLLALGPALALPLLLPSLAFQMRHAFSLGGLGPAGWSVGGMLGAAMAAALAQAALWSPQALVRGLRGARALPRADGAVLAAFTGLVLLSALVRAIPPEPNWWAPAAVVMIVGVAADADRTGARSRRGMLATVLIPTAIACAHTLHPFLPLPSTADPTARLHGWRTTQAPTTAPGTGPYGAAAERCIYREDCDEIHRYFDEMGPHERRHF